MYFRRSVIKWLFFGLFLTSSISGYHCDAQVVSDYADKLDVYIKSYPVYHPASIGTKSRLELNSAYKSLTGLFAQVRTFYTSANFQLNGNSGRNKHVTGITFFSDREGSFFSRSRAYLNYAFHLELQQDLFLAAGTSLGLISYGYKSSTGSPGGADNALTGNAGLWLYNKRFHAGFSIHEIGNARLQPIDEQTTLHRYYVVSGDYKVDLNPYLSLMPTAMLSLYRNYTTLNAGMMASIQQRVSAGLLYKHPQGFLFMAGVENLPILSGEVDILFSYKVPSGKIPGLNVNAYELNLNYRFLKKSEEEDDYYSKSRRKKLISAAYPD